MSAYGVGIKKSLRGEEHPDHGLRPRFHGIIAPRFCLQFKKLGIDAQMSSHNGHVGRMRADKQVNPFRGRPQHEVAYITPRGRMYYANSSDLLASDALAQWHGKANLIFTSPPFPLNTKKRYGNATGEEYIKWLCGFGSLFQKMLTKDGSIVIEMGNSWEPGAPVMSTLALRALLEFQEANKLHLCQEFIYQNPARLPGPAQWVNVERIRVKDSFTKLWWLAPSTKPKANNLRVLQEYSVAMRTLLKNGKYTSGRRPSEHNIGKKSFLKDHGGAIPSNVLTFANTHNSDPYQQYCRDHGLRPHPARMPIDLAKFFVRFLTEPGDLVLDPFAGSNTTGAAAEALDRYWIGIEASPEYIRSSKGRFADINSVKRLPVAPSAGSSAANVA